MKTAEVLKSLMEFHPPNKWAFFDELRVGCGYGKDSEQRFDAWAIHYYPSKRNVTRCYEIKVSRGDFLNEMKKPIKRRAGLRLANEFYFVTPKDLLKIEEIPPECGLMEVGEEGQIETTIRAPHRDVMPPTWLFLSSICRRHDKLRLQEWLRKVENDRLGNMYSVAIIQSLQNHIDKWKNFSEGNKEVPDQIADALEQVYNDAMDIYESNQRVR